MDLRPYDTRHILSPKRGALIDLLSDAAQIPTERVMELLKLGSVYVEGERVHQNISIAEGTYLRIHLKPKRYAVTEIAWEKKIIFENDDLVVVNKPKGVPVHAMVDNVVENVAEQLSRARKIPLYVTQRLDVLTEGLFVLAKTKDFQRAFNKMLKEKRISKTYSARIESDIPVGLKEHFILDSPKAPKLIRDSKPENDGQTWLLCQLEVLACRPTNDQDYEAEVNLITGRTHQIRAQFSHLGFPLVGDRLYGSERTVADFRLVCTKLSFEHPFNKQELRFHIN
jgi:23S rRNA pseudouridine1911/1915/1917 synthase